MPDLEDVNRSTLFDHSEAPCHQALPAGTVTDEFTFVRFAPLIDRQSPFPQPVVVPRGVMNPRVVGIVRRFLGDAPEEWFAGGQPLADKWGDFSRAIPNEPPALKTASVKNPYELVHTRKLKIDDQVFDVAFTAQNINELLHAGATLVVVGAQKQPVRLASAMRNDNYFARPRV